MPNQSAHGSIHVPSNSAFLSGEVNRNMSMAREDEAVRLKTLFAGTPLVYNGLSVSPSGSGLGITVAAGEGIDGAGYPIYVPSTVPSTAVAYGLPAEGIAPTMTLAAAHATLPRIDLVYVRAATLLTDFTAILTNDGISTSTQTLPQTRLSYFTLGVVQGIPAASPVAPAKLLATDLVLAQVQVNAAATVLNAGNIADLRKTLGGAPILNQPNTFSALQTFTAGLTLSAGKATAAASAAAGSGFNLPHGVAPTTPVNGDIWTTTAGLFARINGANQQMLSSVGLSLPSIFTVSGSPVSAGSGTLTATLANQAANQVFAGPASGSAAAPTFRSLVVADLPTVDIAHGGTGATTKIAAFDALSPMSALGDLIYGGAAGTNTRLAGNTTTTRKFLREVGDGTNAAAPTWDTLTAADIPNLDTSKLTSGTLPVGRGGTGLSTLTANGVVYASNTTTLTTAAGTSAQILMANASAVPTWTTLSGDASISNTGVLTLATVPATKGGTGQSAYSVGDLLYASSVSGLSRLAVGAAGTVLIGGVTPSWAPIDLTYLPGAWTKKGVRVATTANISLSGLQTIDGVVLAANDRVLVKDQTTASQNGIYLAQSGAWTRAADADASEEIAGATLTVDEGTSFGGKLFTTTFRPSNTIGSTAMNWYRVYDSSDAVTSNTASKLVLRDASGNFSAGTITAALAGNATTATTLQTPRAINGINFDGSANITVTANTPNSLTRGAYLTGANFNGSAAVTWAVDADSANTANKVVARDTNGDFAARTVTLGGNLVMTGTPTAGLGTRAQVATASLTSSSGTSGTVPGGSANLTAVTLQSGMSQGLMTKVEFLTGTSNAQIKIWRLASGNTNDDLLYWSGTPVAHAAGDIDMIPFELWGLAGLGIVYIQVVAGTAVLKLTSVRII
ncbi:hypothetical protein J7643_19170 [bacterium]|nr:hypothetical protein [bacterium]